MLSSRKIFFRTGGIEEWSETISKWLLYNVTSVVSDIEKLYMFRSNYTRLRLHKYNYIFEINEI
jgi:hypothetical protein